MNQPNEFLTSPIAGQTSTSTPSSPPPQPIAADKAEGDKAEISVCMDKDLLRQIQFLTDDPSQVIEVAVRQWLRGGARRDDDLTRNLERNPPVPTRGEWND